MNTDTVMNTPGPDEPEQRGQVVQFPNRAPQPADTEIVDGELVTPEQEAEIAARRASAIAVRQAAQVVRVVKTGATHPHTKAAAQFVARQAVVFAKGVEAERQRKKAEKHQGAARAARKQALDAGDLERVAVLNKQIQEARHLKVDVLVKWVELGWSAGKKLAVLLVIAFGVALVTGLINGIGHWLGAWNAADVLHFVGATVTTLGEIIGWSVAHWWLYLLAGLGVWGVRRWKDGHRLGEAVLPDHLRREGKRAQYVELTESALAAALANIGNAKLNAAIKDGWPNRDTDSAWVQFPMLDANGKGWGTKIRLPLGVPVAEVRRSVEVLSHNLGCRPQELFIEEDSDDTTVMDLFRLDPGVLREPVPDYPLLAGGVTDYWTGFPVGISPRGDEVVSPVFERNYVIAGMMGSGKTSLVIALLAGAILDPLVDIDLFVFADNADYDVLKPCLNTFVMGDTAENVDACLEHIQGLHRDLAERGQLLQKYGEPSVTREIAAKEPGLRPRIVVIDECQSFFRQDKPEDRKKVVNAVVRFYSAARKYGVTLVFVTPNPSDLSLPRDLVVVTTNRACGAIADKTRNNVVLGEKAHENGISALGLKPAVKKAGKIVALNDVGTTITVGFMDRPGAVRSFNVTRGQQATIVARAIELRGGASEPQGVTVADRDWLADLAEVCGSFADQEKVRLTDAAGWLRKHAPGHRPYQGLDGKTLADWLTEIGVEVTWPARQPTTVTQRIRHALAGRDTEPGGE